MTVLGKWDRNGMQTPREKIYQWRLVNYGTADERAECERCGAWMTKSVYRYRHSLPLVCPKCKIRLHGFCSDGDLEHGEK